VLLYYQQLGLVSAQALRPFDARHDGSALGEGAAALTLETEAAAAERGATVLGEVLGFGSAGEAQGLLPVRDDGDGLVRAIQAALGDAGLQPAQVGLVVAHGNGTPNSDRSEARALARVFGADLPPVTGFKWAFGHLLAAAGLIDAVLAIAVLRAGTVPGIAGLGATDADAAALPLSAGPGQARSDVALVLSRGFGGTNAACLLRAGRA
jgi:3-oxoacyl-[acyl-carrier-protein] synthase-1